MAKKEFRDFEGVSPEEYDRLQVSFRLEIT